MPFEGRAHVEPLVPMLSGRPLEGKNPILELFKVLQVVWAMYSSRDRGIVKRKP